MQVASPTRRHFTACALSVVLSFATVTGQSLAQTPLKIVTSDQAAGGMDSLTRPMADKLSSLLGKPIIVENKAGAQGRIAGQAVATAAPESKKSLTKQNN